VAAALRIMWGAGRREARIHVLEDGRVVEAGPHDALMAAGGRYAELFTLQAAAYLDPPERV
jgi:ATP-binding cassette, subfamily B, bacterial